MKKKITTFMASKELFQGLYIGSPSQGYVDGEVEWAKKLLENEWKGASEFTHIAIDEDLLKGKADGHFIDHGSIACAAVDRMEPTSKDTDKMGSHYFFIWNYHPKQGETLEASLHYKVLANFDWDKEARDYDL